MPADLASQGERIPRPKRTSRLERRIAHSYPIRVHCLGTSGPRVCRLFVLGTG